MAQGRRPKPNPLSDLTPAERRELMAKLKEILVALEKEGPKRDALRKKVRAMYRWLRDPKRP